MSIAEGLLGDRHNKDAPQVIIMHYTTFNYVFNGKHIVLVHIGCIYTQKTKQLKIK